MDSQSFRQWESRAPIFISAKTHSGWKGVTTDVSKKLSIAQKCS